MAAPIVQDLLDRRVPQVAAFYLGGSWGLIGFFAFLEDRYLLSPHLTNLVLLTLLLLLPRRLHEIREEWGPALAAYTRDEVLSPSDPSIPAQVGRVHRKQGEPKPAEQLILRTLSVWPSHARSNYELGLVYMAQGRHGAAIRHLEPSLDSWALASAAHELATHARTRLQEARSQVRAVRPVG